MKGAGWGQEAGASSGGQVALLSPRPPEQSPKFRLEPWAEACVIDRPSPEFAS